MLDEFLTYALLCVLVVRIPHFLARSLLRFGAILVVVLLVGLEDLKIIVILVTAKFL